MPARGELHVYRDPQTVARAAAELFIATGRMAAAERGAFRVALSGGNTPRAAYELLGQVKRYAKSFRGATSSFTSATSDASRRPTNSRTTEWRKKHS